MRKALATATVLAAILAEPAAASGGFVFDPATIPTVEQQLTAQIQKAERPHLGNAKIAVACSGRSPGTHGGHRGFHIVVCVFSGAGRKYLIGGSARYTISPDGKPRDIATTHVGLLIG